MPNGVPNFVCVPQPLSDKDLTDDDAEGIDRFDCLLDSCEYKMYTDKINFDIETNFECKNNIEKGKPQSKTLSNLNIEKYFDEFTVIDKPTVSTQCRTDEDDATISTLEIYQFDADEIQFDF